MLVFDIYQLTDVFSNDSIDIPRFRPTRSRAGRKLRILETRKDLSGLRDGIFCARRLPPTISLTIGPREEVLASIQVGEVVKGMIRSLRSPLCSFPYLEMQIVSSGHSFRGYSPGASPKEI